MATFTQDDVAQGMCISDDAALGLLVNKARGNSQGDGNCDPTPNQGIQPTP